MLRIWFDDWRGLDASDWRQESRSGTLAETLEELVLMGIEMASR